MDARSFRRALKEELGIRTRNSELFREALRHGSSSSVERGGYSYERLEFLGDAILDAIVSEHLYQQYPESDEGFLTRLRSKLVSRERLARLADNLGVLGLLDHRIDEAKLMEAGIGGDALEALVGAYYLDKGYEKTRKWVLKTLIAPLDIERLQQTETDPKSRLIEWAQKEGKEVEFDESPAQEEAHRITLSIDGTPVSEAEGRSKKKAEQKAARLFLNGRPDQEILKDPS